MNKRNFVRNIGVSVLFLYNSIIKVLNTRNYLSDFDKALRNSNVKICSFGESAGIVYSVAAVFRKLKQSEQNSLVCVS